MAGMRLRAPRLGRRLRLSTLLLPATFFALLFLLPLNRRSDILLEDIEDTLHVPHVHHLDPKLPTGDRAGRPAVKGGAAGGQAGRPQQKQPQELKLKQQQQQQQAEPPTREAKAHRRRSGLLTMYDDDELPHLKQHPIEVLIAEAKNHARVQEARVPVSLDSAIALYQELNNGAFPPLGFDSWFEFCVERGIKPWPHQTAYHSVEPYLSIPGDVLRRRQAELDDRVVTSIWTFEDGEVRGPTGSEPAESERVRTIGLLLEPLASYLPSFAESPLKLYFNTDDSPARSAVHAVVAQSRNFAREGDVWPEARRLAEEEQQQAEPGWDYACGAGARFLKESEGGAFAAEGIDDDIQPKSFVYDQGKNSDICLNDRQLLGLHGTMLTGRPHAHTLIPIISQAVTSTFTDVLGLPLDHCNTTVSPLAFAHKADHKLFWRGGTTGVWHSKQTDWRASHRERLAQFAEHGKQGTASVLVKRTEFVREEWHKDLLNERWLDIGFAGAPSQCDESDGTCFEMEDELNFRERVEADRSGRYRYLMDVDGNGWSSRFRRLLTSGSVVFKATLFKEWNSPLLIPWYHYVPVQQSYADVYDVMAFFEGVDAANGRADLAEEIGNQGLAFVEDWWSWSDQQAYMLLLMLELGRAMSDDRAAATFGE